MGRCCLEGQAGKGRICVSPGAISCIRGWAVVGVDPVAVGVTLFAKWILGVLYADPATVRCGQDCALHAQHPYRGSPTVAKSLPLSQHLQQRGVHQKGVSIMQSPSGLKNWHLESEKSVLMKECQVTSYHNHACVAGLQHRKLVWWPITGQGYQNTPGTIFTGKFMA